MLFQLLSVLISINKEINLCYQQNIASSFFSCVIIGFSICVCIFAAVCWFYSNNYKQNCNLNIIKSFHLLFIHMWLSITIATHLWHYFRSPRALLYRIFTKSALSITKQNISCHVKGISAALLKLKTFLSWSFLSVFDHMKAFKIKIH